MASASFDTPGQPKRKRDNSDLVPDEFTGVYLCNAIRQTGGGREDVGEVILDMMRHENLTLEDLKVLSQKLPSFARAEWKKVAPSLGLDSGFDKYQFKPLSLPHAYLPPLFHKRVMKDSMQWLDVYRERGIQSREAARVRLMDAVLCLTINNQWLSFELFLRADLLVSGTSRCAPFSKAVWLICLKMPCLGHQ
jgi:hypothetical protein